MARRFGDVRRQLCLAAIVAVGVSTGGVSAIAAVRGRVLTAPSTSCAEANPQPTGADRQLLRSLLFLGFADEAPQRLALLAKSGVGGFFIMGSRSSATSIKRLKTQLAAIDSGANANPASRPFVAVDEEGGRVQRLKALGILPSARAMGLLSPAAITKLASDHAAKLKSLVGDPTRGITMDFAPVLDLDSSAGGIIANRSFSADPAKAWQSANAFAEGLRAMGIVPVFKHFPGHGHATGDSHKLLPSTPPLVELLQSDLLPFKEMIASPGDHVVMVGHLLVDGLSDDATTPTSMSTKTYTFLRDELHFRGLVLTDDLGMGALAAIPQLSDRVAKAISAGADMALVATTIGIETVLDQLQAQMRKDQTLRAGVIRANRNIQTFRCRTARAEGSNGVSSG
jgi:beta-N-acetylhexosaminidase